jgi:uncharacterized coiled-coil DUF342 family protein
MSKYDTIHTAKDLIREVISNGLSTSQEDINRAADIFGESQIGELANLANSEEKISDKHVGATFYFIAFNIWNWREAIAFYNEHTLKVDGLSLQEIQNKLHALTQSETAARSKAEELQEKWNKTYKQFREHENRAIEAEQEIITLKAKLYDLMTQPGLVA